MSDASIIQSLKQSAIAAERKAAQYRRAGRDDEADAAAKDGRRWLQMAAAAPGVFADADHVAAAVECFAGEGA